MGRFHMIRMNTRGRESLLEPQKQCHEAIERYKIFDRDDDLSREGLHVSSTNRDNQHASLQHLFSLPVIISAQLVVHVSFIQLISTDTRQYSCYLNKTSVEHCRFIGFQKTTYLQQEHKHPLYYSPTCAYLRAGERASTEVPLLRRKMRADIEVEDIHRETHRRARVRYVHNTRNVSLYWRTRQQKVNLIIVVSCPQSVSTTPHPILQNSPYRLKYSITLKLVWRYAIVVSK
jgi:hypothetical protein